MAYFPPPVSNDQISVTQVGTIAGDTPVYIYADVLEELKYSAAQRPARGMLIGLHQTKAPAIKVISLKPRAAQNIGDPSGKAIGGAPDQADAQMRPGDAAESGDAAQNGGGEKNAKDGAAAAPANKTDAPDYVLVTAFKDIYPAQDALEYAAYLRRQRNFRDENEEQTIVGTVAVGKDRRKLMLEDLMLQRTYCADEWQIALFVDTLGDPPRAFFLTKDFAQFAETGYFVISAKTDSAPGTDSDAV